jgi:hypothetical protein
MICGDVAYEGAHNLIVAHAAVQPEQEKNELHADGNEGGHDGGPMDGHEMFFLEEKQKKREIKEAKNKNWPVPTSGTRRDSYSRVLNPLLPCCVFFPALSRLRTGDGQCDSIVDDRPVYGRGLEHVAHRFFMGAGGHSALTHVVRSIA